MNVNVCCISDELTRIINNKNKYGCDVVLYCLSLKELIVQMKRNNNVSQLFIDYLTIIKQHMNCEIDFDFFTFICINIKQVTFTDNEISSMSSSYSSSGSDDLETKITRMLKNDSLLIKDLYDKGEKCLDKNLSLTKQLFNLLDKDEDGHISACDIITTLHISKNMIFKHPFKSTAINLLIQYGKIDFDVFFDNLF